VLEHEIMLYTCETEGLIEKAKTSIQKLAALGACHLYLRKNLVNMYQLTYEDILAHYDMMNDFKNRFLLLNSGMISKILKNDRAMAHVPGIDSLSRLLSMSLRGVMFNSSDKNDELLRKDLSLLCTIFYRGLRGMAHDKTDNGR
jgi:hypothetical protein